MKSNDDNDDGRDAGEAMAGHGPAHNLKPVEFW
jgi:hypothetical protein